MEKPSSKNTAKFIYAEKFANLKEFAKNFYVCTLVYECYKFKLFDCEFPPTPEELNEIIEDLREIQAGTDSPFRVDGHFIPGENETFVDEVSSYPSNPFQHVRFKDKESWSYLLDRIMFLRDIYKTLVCSGRDIVASEEALRKLECYEFNLLVCASGLIGYWKAKIIEKERNIESVGKRTLNKEDRVKQLKHLLEKNKYNLDKPGKVTSKHKTKFADELGVTGRTVENYLRPLGFR